jgi:hypothetical protein
MINFNFILSNPFSRRFNIIFSKSGKLSKFKAWEFNTYVTSAFVVVVFNSSIRTDHAGIDLELGLFGYQVELKFYDTRHWDSKTNTWAVYNDDDSGW